MLWLVGSCLLCGVTNEVLCDVIPKYCNKYHDSATKRLGTRILGFLVMGVIPSVCMLIGWKGDEHQKKFILVCYVVSAAFITWIAWEIVKVVLPLLNKVDRIKELRVTCYHWLHQKLGQKGHSVLCYVINILAQGLMFYCTLRYLTQYIVPKIISGYEYVSDGIRNMCKGEDNKKPGLEAAEEVEEGAAAE